MLSSNHIKEVWVLWTLFTMEPCGDRALRAALRWLAFARRIEREMNSECFCICRALGCAVLLWCPVVVLSPHPTLLLQACSVK